MDELALAKRLIAFDTSNAEGLRRAAEFVGGWLESNDIAARQTEARGLPVTTAEVGPDDGAPTLVLHGHLDVVPGGRDQFEPEIDGDRLYGRGAYDMKGGLAAMMCALEDLRDQDAVRVRFVCVPDEESEEIDSRTSDALVKLGHVGDFAITGEPTNLQVGVQAKGVLAMRLRVSGRSAHGATPWLGDNAVVKAVEVFRGIESLPFARHSSALFDRPSINLGRIWGGDALNKVPDLCVIDVDIRYLPDQDPAAVLDEVRGKNVDVIFVPADIRIIGGHRLHALVPVRHGDRDTVRLRRRGQVPLGAALRQFKGVLEHAIDADPRHHRFLDHHFPFGVGEYSPPDR